MTKTCQNGVFKIITQKSKTAIIFSTIVYIYEEIFFCWQVIQRLKIA